MQQITIKAGEKKTIKKSFFYYITIIYCGMPNENTFSLAYMESQDYRGYGLNIFYEKSKKQITLQKTQFRVISVNPELIILQMIE